MKRITLFCYILVSFISCSQSAETTPEKEIEAAISQPEKVLFIGNSHTYFNDGVDFHVGKMLEGFTLPYTPELSKAVKGGYSLQDHLNDQETLDKIQGTDWDVVVFQENTGIAANERDQALTSIQNLSLKLDKETKVHLFMTWPYENEPENYNTIKILYEEIGPLVKGNVVPVAIAFQNIRNANHMAIDLYASDGVHTTLEGTFLTAAMFTLAIYDIDPTESNYTAGLPQETADYLKTIAKDVYQKYTSP
ncbi:hypothetical protein N9954_04760 [Maribacter sp.]|nr:hypothetical protein [Maribacter sp.]